MWLFATRPQLMPGPVSPLTGGCPYKHEVKAEPSSVGAVAERHARHHVDATAAEHVRKRIPGD